MPTCRLTAIEPLGIGAWIIRGGPAGWGAACCAPTTGALDGGSSGESLTQVRHKSYYVSRLLTGCSGWRPAGKSGARPKSRVRPWHGHPGRDTTGKMPVPRRAHRTDGLYASGAVGNAGNCLVTARGHCRVSLFCKDFLQEFTLPGLGRAARITRGREYCGLLRKEEGAWRKEIRGSPRRLRPAVRTGAWA